MLKRKKKERERERERERKRERERERGRDRQTDRKRERITKTKKDRWIDKIDGQNRYCPIIDTCDNIRVTNYKNEKETNLESF